MNERGRLNPMRIIDGLESLRRGEWPLSRSPTPPPSAIGAPSSAPID
jgi:hypothetical protein